MHVSNIARHHKALQHGFHRVFTLADVKTRRESAELLCMGHPPSPPPGNNNIDGCQGKSPSSPLLHLSPAFLPVHYGIWIYLVFFPATNGKEYL